MLRRRLYGAILVLAIAVAGIVARAAVVGAVVSTAAFTQSYSGDGGTSSFVYPDYLFEIPDLSVSVTASGVTTVYAAGAMPGFNFTGTTDCYGSYPSGGTVNMVDGSGNPLAPAAGASLLISRVTPRTQPVHYLPNGPISACALEHGLDKLTLMAQETTGFAGVSNGAPVTSAGLSLACTALGTWYQNASVAAGANFGWVCTTIGIAGTAVWSPFGLVSQ